MGVCRVASVLEGAGLDVRVLDLCFADDPARALTDALRSDAPAVVGVSVRNLDDMNSQTAHYYLDEVRRQVLDTVRRHAPGVPIVVGGSAVGVAPEEVREALGGDYTVVGDGEGASLELFPALLEGRDPGALPLASRSIPDLDAYPFARGYRWIDWPAYSAYGSHYGIQTKRGCDRACVYCSYPVIEGRAYRLRDPVRVVDEIQDAFERGGVEDFEFVDSTFNFPRDHAIAICDELSRRRLPVKLDTMGLNPAAVDAELIEAMIRAGFNEVSCTPESGSDVVLRGLGKGFSRAQIAEASRVLVASGLPTKWYFLFGGPGECEETVRETFAFIDEFISPEHLVIAMVGIRVLPHTALERLARREGRLGGRQGLLQPAFYFGAMSQEELSTLVAQEVARRPHCCGTTGELWNTPSLMRALVAVRRALRLQGTGWNAVRGYHRLRRFVGRLLPARLRAALGPASISR